MRTPSHAHRIVAAVTLPLFLVRLWMPAGPVDDAIVTVSVTEVSEPDRGIDSKSFHVRSGIEAGFGVVTSSRHPW